MRIQSAKMQGIHWDDLRFVLEVGRAGSFAGAARRLGVNESTVGRRISRIESRLQAKLFARSSDGIMPTSAGRSALRVAESLERQARALEADITGADQRVSGTVRLTAVPMVLNRLVVPSLPGLLADCPDLRVELVADNRNLSLGRRHADIAIRLSRPTREAGVVIRKLGVLDYAVYARDGYPEPQPWINYEEDMQHLPQAQWLLRQSARSGMAAQLRVNDAESLLEAMKTGAGKSLLPVQVGDSEDSMVRLSPEPVLSREIWMLVHPDLRSLGHVRRVMDWLVALFSE